MAKDKGLRFTRAGSLERGRGPHRSACRSDPSPCSGPWLTGKRIVVVGGGIAGLSAAHAALSRAREKGQAVSVTLLERSPRFGGNVLTERVDGFLLDAGPDSWVVTKPQASALARELGLERQLVGTQPEQPPLLHRLGRSPASGARGPGARACRRRSGLW